MSELKKREKEQESEFTLQIEGSFSERCHLLPVTRIYRCKEQSGSCWKKKDAHREGGPYNEF